jgi:hypothetical protein
MTNNNPMKEFSDILEFYQSPPTGTSTHSPTKDIRRCLNCLQPIASSRLSPFCSDQCMNERDKGIEHKPDNNLMRKFSEIVNANS